MSKGIKRRTIRQRGEKRYADTEAYQMLRQATKKGRRAIRRIVVKGK